MPPFKKPVCFVLPTDDITDILSKALKSMQQHGIENRKEKLYKELSSQMVGRILNAKKQEEIPKIIRYYVNIIVD